jgi:hydroxymethylpyrimidine pyrophosphatase-like HAD family hydrolase
MISLDIQPRGWDKAQVVDWIKNQRQYENCKMFFFGDKCHNGGNDESLSKRVTKEGGKAYNVEGPKETLEIISRL